MNRTQTFLIIGYFIIYNLSYSTCFNFVCCSVWYIIRDWGSKLRNRQLKLSDAGSYTCVANNSVGTARIQAFLVVNGMFTLSTCMLSHLLLCIKITRRKLSLRWCRDLIKVLARFSCLSDIMERCSLLSWQTCLDLTNLV